MQCYGIFYAILWEIEIKNLVIWYCMLCYEILTKTPSLTEEIHTFRSKMIRKHYLPLTCCKHLFFQKKIFKIQLKSCRMLCYGMILREILSDRMLLYSNAMLWDSYTMLWDVNAMLKVYEDVLEVTVSRMCYKDFNVNYNFFLFRSEAKFSHKGRSAILLTSRVIRKLSHRLQ